MIQVVHIVRVAVDFDYPYVIDMFYRNQTKLEDEEQEEENHNQLHHQIVFQVRFRLLNLDFFIPIIEQAREIILNAKFV